MNKSKRATKPVEKPVQSYLRRFYYDSLAYCTISLRYLIEVVGSDRVVVGTDNIGRGKTMPRSTRAVLDLVPSSISSISRMRIGI